MDLIDKQYIVRLQIGQHRSQVTLFFQHRAGCRVQRGPHLIGDDMCQRGFPQTRWTKKQDMVQCLITCFGRRSKDIQLFGDRRLPAIIFTVLCTLRLCIPMASTYSSA